MRYLVGFCVCLSLMGCSSAVRLTDISNICSIFDDQRGWYRAAQRSERKWDIPIPTMMAVIYKESSFVPDAKPPRTKFLWVFPGARKSTAYGFSQAKDETWNDFVEATKDYRASRTNFRDSIYFVGWYLKRSVNHANIKKSSVADLYISYHSGLGGYKSGSWRKDDWLRDTAATVQAQANRYSSQLSNCRVSRRSRR